MQGPGASYSTQRRWAGRASLRLLPRSRQRSRTSAGRTETRRAAVDLVDMVPGFGIEKWNGPSAALESAPAVLVRPAESLRHSVDRDVRGDRQFHDRRSYLVWFCPFVAPLVGGLSPLPRTPLPRSDTASRMSFEDFLVRRL